MLGFLVVGALSIASLSSSAWGFPADPQPQPWIATDQPDYSPGSTVVVTGGDWLPGEAVHITANDDLGEIWRHDADVTADEQGAITDTFDLPTDFIALYTVTATGPSGTARTTFTDGNAKVSASPGTISTQVVETLYTSTGCTGTIANNYPKTVTVSAGVQDTIGVGVGDSIRLDAAANANAPNAAFAFVSWGSDTLNSFTVIGGTGGKSICVTGFQSGNRMFTATYAAPSNTPPTVGADNASRAVNEGQTAANTGTYSDPNASNNVAISASVGSITKTGTNSGTWSWSFLTSDGPAQSQTVTITANDGAGGVTTTTFSLAVANVAPTATFNAPGSVSEGSSIALSLTGATDVSSADVAAGFTYAFDCGSGYGAFGASASTTCPTTDDGSRSVGGKVKDKDGGVSTYSATVTITNVAPTASLANDGPDARGEPGHGVLLEPVRPVLGRHGRRVPLRLRLLGGIPGLRDVRRLGDRRHPRLHLPGQRDVHGQRRDHRQGRGDHPVHHRHRGHQRGPHRDRPGRPGGRRGDLHPVLPGVVLRPGGRRPVERGRGLG